MIKLTLPKVEGNKLFTPSFLTFAALSAYFIFSQNVKDSFTHYQPIIAFSCLIFLLSNFIFNFYTLESLNTKSSRSVLMWIHTILQMLQYYFLYSAVSSLTDTSIPGTAIGYFVLTLLLFLGQTLINQQFDKFRYLVLFIGLLALSWATITIYPSFLLQDITLNLRFFQGSSIIMLIASVLTLLRTCQKFVTIK